MHLRRLVSLSVALIIFGTVLPGHAAQTLRLSAEKQVVLESVTVFHPMFGDMKKTIRADLRMPEDRERTREELSVWADEFFLVYFGAYAQNKGYESAAVAFSKNRKVGPFKFGTAQNFLYTQQENDVWQPEHESLMDDEPLPKAKAVKLPSGREIHVEAAGKRYLHKAGRSGWGSDYWSEVSIEDDPATVYQTSREYWQSVKDSVDPSLGIVGIFAFDRPRLGYFHFRKYLYVLIKADANGQWQRLPPTLDEARSRKTDRIQASFGPQGLETVWPER